MLLIMLKRLNVPDDLCLTGNVCVIAAEDSSTNIAWFVQIRANFDTSANITENN